jgi:predicted phage tail component-like protein
MYHFTRFYSNGVTRRAPVADGTSFDGHLFSEHNIVVERIIDPLPSMREELVDNNGRHGSSVRSLHMSPRSISLECRLFTGMVGVFDGNGDLGDWYDYDGALQYLAASLYTPNDRRLVLRNHPGQYYMAHFTSMDEGDRDNQSAGFTLNFTASDPLRYSTSERVIVASVRNGQTFEVDGTDEARLTIDVAGAPNTQAVVWLYSEYAFKQYELKLYETTSANMVTYDCVNHIAIVGSGESQHRTGIALDSEWPVLAPGRWRVEPRAGTATLTWRQAWR